MAKYYQIIIHCILYLVLIIETDLSLGVKLDPDVVKNTWIPNFSKTLMTFSNDVLSPQMIQRDISNHRRTKVSKTLAKDIQNEVFQDMCQKIGERFFQVKTAVFKIKTSAETKTKLNQGIKIARCCKSGPVPGMLYEGRLRQDVNKNLLCIGSRNSTSISKIDSEKLFPVFKDNYQTVASVLWQYYADIDGDFVEYPDSNSHQCDKNGSIISPLTEDWFAVKHLKTEKNLVIVYDVGSNTESTVDSRGRKFSEIVKEAVKETLHTLTPNDKVNIIAFNETAQMTKVCNSKLFIANQRNKDILSEFVSTMGKSGGVTDYSVGLEAAYKLLERENLDKQNNPTSVSDIVILITDGKTPTVNTTKLFTMIENHQKAVGRSISHVVFSLEPSTEQVKHILTNIAEQHVPNWPVGLNISIRPTGVINQNGIVHFFPDLKGFPTGVAREFTSSLPVTTNTDKEYSVIAPVIEDNLGLKMTISVPVIDKSSNNSVTGTAAIDVSMETVFTEIEDFVLGVHSYAFLLEKRHGHVLLHPKLKDPANTKHVKEDDNIFPSIQTLEPNLSQEQIKKITNEGHIGSFSAKVANKLYFYLKLDKTWKSTFMSNLDMPLQDSTIMYQHLDGTQFVMVMVMFHSDSEVPKLMPIPPGIDIKNAPYHRLDISHSFPVCSIDGHIVTTAATTVKLSPSVFVDSEVYKFTEETQSKIGTISDFLSGRNNTSIIKEGLKKEIWHSLIETQSLTDYWRNSKNKVIERFFGSPSGVFRMYPGVALTNTFDHIQYTWYKKSVARFQDIVFTSGKISEFTTKDVMILSRALSENIDRKDTVAASSLQGVVGATLTHSQLTAMLINNQVWCTSMSEGNHELSYSLQIPVIEHDVTAADVCRQYVIGAVNGTNLFILVVNGRGENKCTESKHQTEVCDSCGIPYAKCSQCINGDKLSCQCPCYCEVDFDQCSSQFDDTNSTNFPHSACYYEPLFRKLTEVKQLTPVLPCKVPCQAIEEENKCNTLVHCKWEATLQFPLCVYDEVTTTATQTTPTKKLIVPTKKHNLPTKKPIGPTKKPNLSSKMPNLPTKMPNIPSKKTNLPGISTNSIPSHTHKVPPKPIHTHKIPPVLTKKIGSTKSSTPLGTSIAGSSTLVVAPTLKIVKDTKSGRDNTGLVVGLVLAVIILAALIAFIAWRFYGKNIQKALGNTKAGKYVRRNSVVDRVMFSKVNEEIITSKGPAATSVPYGQID
ncbi:Hypothetical predicted protein [Mytilus galloprovincialis]|uniref:VWFA domain-containing protein n=1 Tax=Mytilus galloprovincialis TaxID=29158 RepID=A0A8B6EHC7_MYTGA|nr:Hypothetical predicted protein [Mytilus galloprovincialis]